MIVYGKQIFFYILKHHKNLVNELYLAKECDKKTFLEVKNSGFKINKLDFKKAQSLAKGRNHQGFLMDIKDYSFASFDEVKSSNFVVILNELSDIGNIGAIIRTCYCFGIGSVVCICKNISMENVIRSSSGAALDVRICLNSDIFAVLNELKQVNFKLFASSSNGKIIHNFEFKNEKKALILGSEGCGLSEKIIKKCHECVGIKMRNNFNSLNVSAAFAILCDRMIHV